MVEINYEVTMAWGGGGGGGLSHDVFRLSKRFHNHKS